MPAPTAAIRVAPVPHRSPRATTRMRREQRALADRARVDRAAHEQARLVAHRRLAEHAVAIDDASGPLGAEERAQRVDRRLAVEERPQEGVEAEAVSKA